MLKKLLVAASLLATPALAQNVQYVSPVTRGHIPVWNTNGVIADGGSSADSPITSIGVTNNGGAGICVSSDRQTALGRNQLCFGASTAGPATISLQNYGTAAPQNLNFVINGVTVTIPTGGGAFLFGNPPFTDTHMPCFVGTSGVVQDCGVGAVAGAITTGAWQATPVAVAFGGTGATDAPGARTNLGLGTMAVQNANAVAVTGGTVTGMPTPVNPTDVAIKSYVDATASGLNILAPSTLATAAILPNTPTYANGTLGVGATLTAGSNTTLTVDGTAAPLNTVVLVKNQAAPAQNGIYKVTTAGDGSNAWVLTRATYFDQAAEMKAGSYTFVTTGSTNINTSYTLQAAVTTVGTDPLNFVQFSSGSSGTVTSAAIAAGTGISVTGVCTITTVGTCTVANTGVVSLGGINGVVLLGPSLTTNGSTLDFENPPKGASVNLNSVNEAWVPPNPNKYHLFIANAVKFNQGSLFTSCCGSVGAAFKPPNGTNLLNLIAQTWITSGVVASGNMVAKWIKNATVDGSNNEVTGTDVCAGVGSQSDFGSGTAIMRADCYDVPSNGDYYNLFMFVDSTALGSTAVVLDGNPAHTYVQAVVIY